MNDNRDNIMIVGVLILAGMAVFKEHWELASIVIGGMLAILKQREGIKN